MGKESGWFKVHRSVFDNPVVMKDSDHLALWIYLLGHATHLPYDTLYCGKRITLQPGELIASVRKIEKDLKIDKSKVSRIFKAFKTETQIETTPTDGGGQVISIVNWDEYQNSETPNETQMRHQRDSSETPVRHIQEQKNNKNKKNNPPIIPQGNIKVDGPEMEFVRNVVEYLNMRTDKHYRPNTDSTRKKILARRNEGFTLSDFHKVIDIKTVEWMNTEREKYLRPETLFGSKFEGYLNQRPERKKMNPVEIARAMDEAERRRQYDEGAGCPDVHQGFSGIPQYLPGNE